jgi:hypothetical protein
MRGIEYTLALRIIYLHKYSVEMLMSGEYSFTVMGCVFGIGSIK